MSRFISRETRSSLPRLPLSGGLDLTYRCNNDCRHCWLRLAPDDAAARQELSFDEIRAVVDEARSLGCRHWSISGGEPMLRPDFAEIFECVTARSSSYTLNTNGTLITPAIAGLMKRSGSKLVALYGADAAVHDRVTRNPGSFEALRRGVSLLRQAGAAFTVQIVPMKSNYAQLAAMIELAKSWSPSWRLGANWLYLSASADPGRNRDILAERLAPAEILDLERADGPSSGFDGEEPSPCPSVPGAGLYAGCLAGRRDFHIDPCGGMSFCCFVKDPALRLDLGRMSFREAWDEGLPALAGKVKPGKAYAANCGSCELRADCRWCPVYAYLEHRDHSARIDYLCALAREEKARRTEWERAHRRYYGIGGLTLRIDSDLPITDSTFQAKLELFRVPGPGGDAVTIRHHFALPDLDGRDLGREIYRKPPWAIYRKGGAWIYVGIYPDPGDKRVHRVLVFNDDHTRGRVFNPDPGLFLGGGLESLLLLSSDQILLARLLPSFGGAFVHAAGVKLRGQGLLFVGPSEAGKSTTVKMLMGKADILCDDRMIVRKGPDGFRIHGTWSHGEVPLVSPDSAPFRALLFLRQSRENRLERIEDPKAVLRNLLPRFIRPLETADWWDRILTLAGEIAAGIPCYDMHFDKSGRIVEALEEMCS